MPNFPRVPVGVMVSVNDGGVLKFGSAYLNPEDAALIARENVKTRKKIAAAKREQKLGKKQPDGLKLKPVFDKVEALKLAQSRLVEVVDMNSVAPSLRAPFRKFVKNAHATKLVKEKGLIVELTDETRAKAQKKGKK